MADTSFPFPKQLPIGQKRPLGQGCLACVKRPQCPAWYWRTRYGVRRPNDEDGTLCDAWSDDPSQAVGTPTEYDMEENQRRSKEGILIEPNPSGFDC